MDRSGEIVVQKNVPATMRDGTTLVADVYRPGGEGSEGEWSPSMNEFEDGYDTVEWAAKLPGSNGDVGMYGASYFGMTQWQAAVMQPPSLKSLAPGITWGNYLNGEQYRGGARELGLWLYWCQVALALESLFRKYRTTPDKLEKLLPAQIDVIDNLPEHYETLPLEDLSDPGGVAPYMYGALEQGVASSIWEYLNIDGRYGNVEVPTLHIGCWYDVFLGETLRQYEAMKEAAAGRGTRPPRLLIGPWSHGTTFPNMVGDLDFGLASSGLFLNYKGDVTDYHLRWFDATLKGEEGALEKDPPVEVFVMGENRWRGYEEWPVRGSREERWHLHANGILSREEPESSPPDEYDYDPKDPVPSIGGAILMPAVYRAGPRDQRPIEERQDMLVYTSEELLEDYTAIGPVYVTLYAASSAPDTDFVARLVDVYPDGRAMVVTDGIIRASARESYPAPGTIKPAQPTLIEPGEVY